MPASRLVLPTLEPAGGRPAQVVLLAEDTAAQDRAVVERSNPDGGVLTLAVSPMTDGLGRLCGDLLDRLGKSEWTAPETRVAVPERYWAQAWLRGRPIRRVVLHRADPLTDGILHEVAGVIAAAGAEAWFTFAALGPMMRAVELLPGNPQQLDGAGLLELLEADPPRILDNPRQPSPLKVGGVAPPTRDPEWAALVQEVQASLDPLRSEARLDALFDLEDALEARGWRLRTADLGRFLDPTRSGRFHLPREWGWEAFHRLRDTAMPAAAVIAWCGASILEMLALRARHVAADGSAVAVAGEILRVPSAAHPFLRTRLAALEQLAPDTPFLASDWGEPLLGRRLRTMIGAAFEEVGVVVARRETPFRTDPSRRWLERNGLRLTSTVPRGAAAIRYALPGRTERTASYRTRNPNHPWRHQFRPRPTQ